MADGRVITVILDRDYRMGDVELESILSAIRMVRGVEAAEAIELSSDSFLTRATVALEMRRKVFEALHEALPIWPK